MNKKEILEVLKEMLADYESALIYKPENVEIESLDFFNFLRSKNLEIGFCCWLDHSIFVKNTHWVILFMKSDLQRKVYDENFWYPTSTNCHSMNQIKEFSLFPRVQHLLRTIKRLESELK